MDVEKNPEYEKAFGRMRRRKKMGQRLRRMGCVMLLVVWFGLLLTPCFFVTLIMQGELVVPRSDVPDHEIRLFFLDEPDQRGFGLSRAKVASGSPDGDEVCLLTDIDYLLWEGDSGGALTYCNCYEKIDGNWAATMIGGNRQCEPVEFEFGDES